jgi:hypothetical protein
MTERADRLTKRAKTAASPSVRSSYPASSARVFVDALERLNYSVDALLSDAGIRRADLDDPDARAFPQNETTSGDHSRLASLTR